MASAGIQVEGLNQTVKALEAAGVEVDELKDVMGTIATAATEELTSHLPSRSGKLRASARGNRAKGKAIVTIGRATVPYAGPILHGWPSRGIKPSTAIPRTDAVMQTKAPELLEQGLTTILERHGLT